MSETINTPDTAVTLHNSRDIHAMWFGKWRQPGQWRMTEADLKRQLDIVKLIGHTRHEYDFLARDGEPCTVIQTVNRQGRTSEVYHIDYYTRVPCVEGCEYSWASAYQTTIGPDGRAMGPVARCGMHAERFRDALHGIDTIELRETRLKIGQHD